METIILPVQIGTQLLLQVRQVSDRLPSKLVGLEHGRYLIISVPALSISDIKSQFPQGKILVVRYLHEGRVLGFESSVMGVIIHPVSLIFLKYPQKVDDMNLRKHRRSDCYLPGGIIIGTDSSAGFIIDISRGGSCISCKSLTKFNMNSLAVGTAAILRLAVPGVEGKLDVGAVIRNIRTDDSNTFFGLQFTEINESKKQKLYTFLDEMQSLEGAK